jgi:hypothetical protein
LANKQKQTADQMMRQLDGVHVDKTEVHIAACVDLDTFLKTFTTQARRCRSHAQCVLVSFRNVGERRV